MQASCWQRCFSCWSNIELYLGRNRRFKSNWEKGLLIVEVWIYYWWIYCKYICSLRMVLRTVADLHFLKRHSGKYCVAEHTFIRSRLRQTFLLLQWIFIKGCRTCISYCSSQSLHFKICWIFFCPVFILLAYVMCQDKLFFGITVMRMVEGLRRII